MCDEAEPTPYTSDEAHDRTDRVARTLERVNELLLEIVTELDRRQAPRVLGYESTSAYVQYEFGRQAERAYELLTGSHLSEW